MFVPCLNTDHISVKIFEFELNRNSAIRGELNHFFQKADLSFIVGDLNLIEMDTFRADLVEIGWIAILFLPMNNVYLLILI
jgi:hypothetical protein